MLKKTLTGIGRWSRGESTFCACMRTYVSIPSNQSGKKPGMTAFCYSPSSEGEEGRKKDKACWLPAGLKNDKFWINKKSFLRGRKQRETESIQHLPLSSMGDHTCVLLCSHTYKHTNSIHIERHFWKSVYSFSNEVLFIHTSASLLGALAYSQITVLQTCVNTWDVRMAQEVVIEEKWREGKFWWE